MGEPTETSTTAVDDKSSENLHISPKSGNKNVGDPQVQTFEEQNETESISEHIIEYYDSSHSENETKSRPSPDLLKALTSDVTSSFKDSPLPSLSYNDDNSIPEGKKTKKTSEQSLKQSRSWPVPSDDDTRISLESPAILPIELSSYSYIPSESLIETSCSREQQQMISKSIDGTEQKKVDGSDTGIGKKELNETNIGTFSAEKIQELSFRSHASDDAQNEKSDVEDLKDIDQGSNKSEKEREVNIISEKDIDDGSNNSEQKISPRASIKSEKFTDSLSESNSHDKAKSSSKTFSLSEEIIKLDIRGQAAPKIPFTAEKIIFGLPPECDTFEDSLDNIPIQMITPFVLSSSDNVEEILQASNAANAECYYDSLTAHNQKLEQSDRLVEELTIQDAKENVSFHTQTKSFLPDIETGSFSTMTTDYKTICEEYHGKLLHMEEVISQRELTIDKLKISLQQRNQECQHLELENQQLTNKVHNLQHYVSEMSTSEHDTVKGQLSDFIKYQNLIKDDSTKFYSAIMSNTPSSGCASRSSNGEKDMDREEVTINFTKSDLKTSESSLDSQEFDQKLSELISTFDEYIEDDARDKLKGSLILLLTEEVNRLRRDCDTEVKDAEKQFLDDKQAFNTEIRKLKELLSSVKAGSADIEKFQLELNAKHEKEMENLRTYFEKKCSDLEKHYSEEVELSARAASSGGSASSLEAACEAALPYSSPLRAGGDYTRRTATFHTHEIAQLEVRLKQESRKHEQQLDTLKAEHVGYVNDLQATHREAISSLEEQVQELKAHIQTQENTNSATLYQDIDLELEKHPAAITEEALHQVRREIIQQMEEQIKVLLADPAAELSSWPLDLVALRDKIHTDTTNTIRQMKISHQQELTQLRAELSGGEGAEAGADKWRQRRNHSFDQNRQLAEVTKERDGFKRVACTLQRVVTQLVAYCVAAEDELNKTVLTELISHIVQQQDGSLVCDADSPHLSPLSAGACAELDSSTVSQRSARRHVHFAPDLRSVFAEMDEDAMIAYLQHQDDLSLEIKNDLELSLKRLRQEAQDLLDLSGRFVGRQSLAATSNARRQLRLDEKHEVGEMTRLVEGVESQRYRCDACDVRTKHLEESEERESLLRAELRHVQTRLAHISTHDDPPAPDLIAEGYGTLQHPRTPVSLPVRTAVLTPPLLDSRSVSLDCSSARRAQDLLRLSHEVEGLAKERDDLVMQLEAANRQLRSTRLFVEEQTTERELERDEFARQVRDLRDENARLGQRLQSNARILNEVEQLEAQTREMNTIIAKLETKKSETDSELKATIEKISLLRDIIANLESQLEQKSSHESEILEKLEEMKCTIDERDSKMRGLLGELESLKSAAEQTDLSVRCPHSQVEDAAYGKLLDKIKEQARWLEDSIHRRTQQLERLHEAVSTSCSEPSEDVSIRDQKNNSTPDGGPVVRMPEMTGVWECLEAHSRAEDAAFKRIRDLEMQRVQLKDVAQEVRAERDVLQQRMSEQALKISSLAARLELQRTHAEALAHENSSKLSVQLHDALAEVQRLTEEVESKDKQLARLKLNTDDSKRSPERQTSLFDNTCQPNDKVIILERELAAAHNRVVQLEFLAKSLEQDKITLSSKQRELQRQLAEREAQLQELLALKLDNDNQKEQKSEIQEGGKNSARTLSDIVSISDYDEQDLQMRRAEMKSHNISTTGFNPNENKSLNKTLPPDLNEKPQLSSLNIEHTIDHLDLAHFTHSLPAYLTSTANKNLLDLYKRNINETTVFGIGDSVKHSTAHGLPDNCSQFPNRELNESKNVSIEPKRIDFSVGSTTHDNMKTLEEMGFDPNQDQYPDILTQMKQQITNANAELEECRAELKQAEEQLCEFPALKEEVEELKTILEGTMATMEEDKKFYVKQLENFTTTNKLLQQQLSEVSEQVNEKSNDLHILKEDILRRENMVLELAKEKRNLVNKMTELELKYETLESRNNQLEKFESENKELKERLTEVRKMEQLVSEKNLQIDNLNEHLNRLDDLQRRLDDKNEEVDRLKETIEEKSNELFQLQDTNQAMSRDLATISNENSKYVIENRELINKISKLGKDQENTSLQLKTSITELEKMSSCNIELSTKLEDIKILTDKLKDKECEIEILNEDIKYFHDEIASLKEELMVSRSPSPRGSKSGSGEEKKSEDKRVNNDKKELVKIRKHVSLLQHELAFNKKDLNEKAFELGRARLDVTELRNNLNQCSKLASEREMAVSALTQDNCSLRQQLQALTNDKQQLSQQLVAIEGRLKEEADLSEVEQKLKIKTEECRVLEEELAALRETMERMRDSPGRALAILPAEDHALVRSGQRSPTAELESCVRAQLSYSHQLDDSIMEQILSSADTERDEDDLHLHLDLSNGRSSNSIHTSTSEKLNRLCSDNEKLKLQLTNLEARLQDKDALIAQLNKLHDKLAQDWESAKLKYESEKDNSDRLQLLLSTQKETADSLQTQDLNMISILKKRLEKSMAAELDLQQNLQQEKQKSNQLQRQLAEIATTNTAATSPRDSAAYKMQIDNLSEQNERLKGEITLLKSKLDREKSRLVDLQSMLDQRKLHFQREVESRNDICADLKQQLLEAKRLKQESGAELVKAKEVIHQLERKLADEGPGPFKYALSEFEEHKAELSREISALKRSLDLANTRETNIQHRDNTSDDLLRLKAENASLQEKIRDVEQDNISLKNRANCQTDDKDQAVRFLHSRCLRLESCRKALVWQKRYLQRVLHPYTELEKYLQQQNPPSAPALTASRFKSAVLMVIAVVRMGYLVRRRQHIRTVSADALLRKTRDRDPISRENTLPRAVPYTSNSPPSRDSSSAPPPPPRLSVPSPHFNQTLYLTPPHRAYTRHHIIHPRSTFLESGLGERRSDVESLRACSSTLLRSNSSLCDDAASVQSSIKDQMDSAAKLAHKLDSMSRRLQQVMTDSPRDVP